MDFKEAYQQYIDESDPDYHVSMEALFQWFFDKGQEAMKEKSAKLVEGYDTCMCCSEYEISAAIRAIA